MYIHIYVYMYILIQRAQLIITKSTHAKSFCHNGGICRSNNIAM